MNCRNAQFDRLLLLAMLTSGIFAGSAPAQNGRPGAARPESQAQPDASGAAPAVSQSQPNGGAVTTSNPIRLPVREGKVALGFNDVPIDDAIFRFIAETTGKVVMPVNPLQLKSKKITVLNETPVDRAKALDLVLTVLRLNGVGIIETNEVVILDMIEQMVKRNPPVLSANEDVMSRIDRGTYVVKIFRLSHASAEGVGERLTENLPDHATLSVDTNSNQIILYGDIELAQHAQRLINELDHNHIVVQTETFVLKYADATAVADQIMELFDESGAAAAGGAQPGAAPRQPRQPGANGRQARAAGGGAAPTPAGVASPGPIVELRVSVNTKQNAITVLADPARMKKIGELIREWWDLPTPQENTKVYTLKYTDPLKVRDLLQSLLGQGGGRSGGGGGGARGAGGAQAAQQPRLGGGGGGSGATEVVGDIYRIEAFPDSNSVVVLSKTTDALHFLDEVISKIDQPSSIGMPEIVELKHANAVNLADEINVLLAEAGSGGGLTRPQEGLNAQGPGGFGDSSTGSGTSGASAGALNNRGSTGGGGGAGGGTIEFPWQRGRQRDDQTPETSLIGRVRIVPIVRQNALAVLAPVAQLHAVTELIQKFDKPGRQVMISAILAEVQLGDDFALGIRLSSSGLAPTNPDYAFTAGGSFTGTSNDVLSDLFDTSVLDVNADINVLLQALSQHNKVRIIQEPRVFTADNQEAAFFNGQEIPFISNSVVNGQINGGVTQSFEYKDVGILLNVRPHITVQRDVDLEINLSLSAVVPGVTLFGGAVLDKRSTNTKVIVKNGQTIVLSGLLKDVDSKVTRGIPLLSDIPLLGALFKSYEDSKVTNELVAFITPIVVDNPSENDDNYNKDDRAHLRELAKPLDEQSKNKSSMSERIRANRALPYQKNNPDLQNGVKPEAPFGNEDNRTPVVDIDEVDDDSEPK